MLAAGSVRSVSSGCAGELGGRVQGLQRGRDRPRGAAASRLRGQRPASSPRASSLPSPWWSGRGGERGRVGQVHGAVAGGDAGLRRAWASQRDSR